MENNMSLFKKIVLVGLCAATIINLQGCVGAAFVAGAAATGVIVNDRRSLSAVGDDEHIEHLTNLKLQADNDLYQRSHVVVSSYNRILLVAGQVPTDADKQRLMSHIQEVDRIKRIYNEITVSEPTSNLTRSSDTWITTKAKSQMLLTKDLKSSQIKVITENGIVYLMGIVTPQQGDTAVSVVRHIAGVQKVVKLFEYMSVVE
jgi:osmotically-inducible protein OsmY